MRKKTSSSWIIKLLILIGLINLIKPFKKDDYIIFQRIFLELFNYFYSEKLFSKEFFIEEENCLIEIVKTFLEDLNVLKNLFQYNGKAIGDIGNEIECNNHKNFYYLLFQFQYRNYDKYLEEKDKIILEFLNQTNYFIGICFFKKCKNIFHKLKDNENFLSFFQRKFAIYNIKVIEENNKTETNFVYYLIIGLLILLIVKFIIGLFRYYVYPKGYDYYYNKIKDNQVKFNYKTLQKNTNDLNKDLLLSETQNIINNKNKEKNEIIEDENNKKMFLTNIQDSKYIPEFDNSRNYPFKMKLFKFLNIFDNIKNLYEQYNRFFNSNNINSLITIKVIILFFIVNQTILKVERTLPGRFFNIEKFYKSELFIIIKLSIFGTISLIMIDGAILGFKIMSFIKNEINKRKRFNPLLLFTFLIINIPKICTFFFIYFIFYIYGNTFNNFFFNNSMNQYYNTNIKEEINCFLRSSIILNPFFLYKNYHENSFNTCYEFVYVYENEFYLFIFIIFFILLCFYLKNQLFEKLFFTFGIIYFFFIQLFNYKQMSKKNPQIFQNDNSKLIINFNLIHILGENYSIKLPHLSICYYFFGFILGLCYFFYYDSKDKFPLMESKIIKHNIIYIPFKFCKKFVNYLNNLSYFVKNLFFILNFLFIILLSLNHKIFKIDFNKISQKEGKFEKNSKIFFFYFEKFTFAFFFFFLNLFILVFPNDSLIKEILTNEIFIIFGRVSFAFYCLCDSIIFLAFSIFILGSKTTHFNSLINSIGLYLILFFLSLIITILIEYPLRIIIKLLIRKRPTKSELEILNNLNSDFSLSLNDKEESLLID